MRHIFYSSQAVDMNQGQFDSMVERAALKNRVAGIFGAIAWDGGIVTQIIEGPANAVDDLYRIIRNDRRHTGVVLLIRADITASQFQGFGMSRRAPYELYLTSLSITDRCGWGNTSAIDLDAILPGTTEDDIQIAQ